MTTGDYPPTPHVYLPDRPDSMWLGSTWLVHDQQAQGN
jgi:hypothetical protein